MEYDGPPSNRPQGDTMYVETPDELVELLERLSSEGGPSYRAEASSRTATLSTLLQRLSPADQELLLQYEEDANRDAARWAAHHFQFGFAIGQSGVLDTLEALGLVEDDSAPDGPTGEGGKP